MLITENGTPLFESDAIVEYVDEISAPLEPNLSTEERAISRAWSYQATKHYLTQCSVMRSEDETTLTTRSKKLSALFEKAEKVLGDTSFFQGETIGNVDVAWLPILHRADIINRHTCHDIISDYPKVKAWQESLMDSGIADESVSEDFEDVFTEFYLSDKSFLGNKRCVSNSLDKRCDNYTCC